MGDEVTKILFGRLGQAGWELLTEETLLEEVRNVFVKKRNRMINRLKLHNLMQGPDQPVQQYVSSLKQIARTCQYSIVCSRQGCNTRVDYSQEIVLDQLVRGLNDDEIQKKVLSTKEEEFNLNSVEKIIVAEESSKATQLESKGSQSGYVAPMSTYKKIKKLNATPSQSGGKCQNCGGHGHQAHAHVEPMARPAISAKNSITLRLSVTLNLFDKRMIQKMALKTVQWLCCTMLLWMKARKSEKSINSMESSHLFNPDEDSFNICILIKISINLCQNQ